MVKGLCLGPLDHDLVTDRKAGGAIQGHANRADGNIPIGDLVDRSDRSIGTAPAADLDVGADGHRWRPARCRWLSRWRREARHRWHSEVQGAADQVPSRAELDGAPEASLDRGIEETWSMAAWMTPVSSLPLGSRTDSTARHDLAARVRRSRSRHRSNRGSGCPAHPHPRSADRR